VENRGIQNYRDLAVWQKAIALSVACYRVTSEFPKEEMYGMTAQIRRASVSVAANIAEGHGREHTRTFVQFLRISQGSLKELETHLILAEQVAFWPREWCSRCLHPLMKSVVCCEP
jgi:four helix bundle protein